jgi:hypothetical protein
MRFLVWAPVRAAHRSASGFSCPTAPGLGNSPGPRGTLNTCSAIRGRTRLSRPTALTRPGAGGSGSRPDARFACRASSDAALALPRFLTTISTSILYRLPVAGRCGTGHTGLAAIRPARVLRGRLTVSSLRKCSVSRTVPHAGRRRSGNDLSTYLTHIKQKGNQNTRLSLPTSRGAAVAGRRRLCTWNSGHTLASSQTR